MKYVLTANASGFVGGMKMARTAVKDLNADLLKNGQSAESFLGKYEQSARDVTTGLGLIGAAATAGAGIAAKTFASFDKQMSAVKATGGATAKELADLRQEAIELGASTSFSASEAAAGIENMLKAGVTAQDTLGGGLKGALDLAASGALSVADAAEIAAGTMTQFKLGGEDVTHIADLLAAGAGKAQGDVSDLAGALKYAGVPVAQLGVTLEETTGTLALFASNALVGEQAGTSLRSMVMSLTSPSKIAAKEMESLGINVFDGQDKFIGLAGAAGQLKARLGEASDAERSAALGRIFGNESIQAANILLDAGAEKVNEWTDAVNDQGYAARTAADRLDNLSGDLEGLSGAFETLLINSGSGANSFLREATQTATGLVNVLSDLPAPLLNATTLLAGSGGLALLGVAGMGKLVIGVNSAKGAVEALGWSMKGASAAAGAVGAAVAVAAVGLTVWAQNAAEAQAKTDAYADTLDDLGKRTDATLSEINAALTTKNQRSWIDNIFGKDPEYLVDRAEKIGLAVEDLQGYVLGERDAVDKVTAATEAYVSKQDDVLTKGDARKAASVFLLGALDAEASGLTNAERAQAKKAAADEAAGVSQEELQQNYATTTGAIDEQVASLGELIEAQAKAAGVVLDEREARRAYQEQLDAARKSLKENGETLDRNTEAGRANEEALDGIAEKSLAVAASMEQNGKSQEQVRKFVKASRDDFLAQADALGMGEEKAEALADKLGLVPGDYKADISVNTAAAEVGLRDFLNSVESADGTLKIKGDGAPAERKLDDVTAQVNDADGSVKIFAKDGKALATLRDYTATVDESDGTVTIKGKDKQGRRTVLKLTDWVGEQSSSIPVNANTKGAQKDVNQFIKDNTKLAIKIGTQFFAPKSAMGDGEGAGWTGKTPRGVAQMSKAVQAIDPGAQITSGYRPGAVTATGYPSYHGMGRAIDIVSPNMGHTWDLLRRAFPMAKELFYTPRGFLRNGVMGGAAPVTRRTHYSHVHLALKDGGAVTGPGTGTSDDVPIWASNGEHMWTEREVAAVGGHRAMYRLRAAALKGALITDPEATYKVGGAVGSATRALDAAEARRDAAARKVKEARAAVRRARKTKKEADDRAAEKRLDAAEKLYERRKEEVDKARERRSALSTERTEFATDMRRGNILDSATSGADGAYGVVDDMLGLASSGNLTKGQSNRLAKKAREAETAMRGLYKQIEGIDKRLEKATARVEKLQGISDSVRNTLKGEQALGNSIKEAKEGEFRDVVRTNSRGDTWNEQVWDPGTKASVTAKDLVADAKGKAGALRAFAGKLNKLRSKGLRGTVLQEVAELGSEQGSLVADALLKEPEQISELNKAYGDISKYSSQAGEYVTDAFSKGGLSAAKSFEAGLEKEKASLEKHVYNWGVVMADAISVALTGKHTTLKKRAAGGPVTAGELYQVNELGTEMFRPNVNGYVLTADQTRHIAATAPAPTTTFVPPTGGNFTVQVDSITTVDPDAAMRRLKTEMRDAAVMHGLRTGVLV
ncbi:phage tail tape measure protein [Isoptericola sp. NPDC056605]|uniref:phage tail tape measure protein n=1 Tax=Isoptericola sp. NPDC056605 TaxID=3345876 RepID=UPI0036B16B75